MHITKFTTVHIVGKGAPEVSRKIHSLFKPWLFHKTFERDTATWNLEKSQATVRDTPLWPWRIVLKNVRVLSTASGAKPLGVSEAIHERAHKRSTISERIGEV